MYVYVHIYIYIYIYIYIAYRVLQHVCVSDYRIFVTEPFHVSTLVVTNATFKVIKYSINNTVHKNCYAVTINAITVGCTFSSNRQIRIIHRIFRRGGGENLDKYPYEIL